PFQAVARACRSRGPRRPIAHPIAERMTQGERSSEGAFTHPFTLWTRLRGANQGGEVLIWMRQDMTFQSARATGDRVREDRRERGIEGGGSILLPRPVQPPK